MSNAIKLGHLEFTLRDLPRHGVEVLCGPLRHGCGHNIAVYHCYPKGLIIARRSI